LISQIVVEKLTKNVNENHLREIFGSYGPIKDLDLPMNKQFMTNRGTAYILYANTTDAEAAIAHMHEAQLDGAIINPEEADHHSTASMGVDLHLDLTVEELLPADTQDHRQDDTDRHHRQDAPLPLGDMDVDQVLGIGTWIRTDLARIRGQDLDHTHHGLGVLHLHGVVANTGQG
ncbi:MAG: hypothetical protein Q9224_001387, partial [Gallowayella concinna]